MKLLDVKKFKIALFGLGMLFFFVFSINTIAMSKSNNELAFTQESKPLNDAIIANDKNYFNLEDNTIIERDGNLWITKTAANNYPGVKGGYFGYSGTMTVQGKSVTGTLTGIENFTKIREMYILNTDITGTIPEEMGKMSKIEYLYITGNKGITGEIPKTFVNNNFNFLYLQNNSLTGTIPAGLAVSTYPSCELEGKPAGCNGGGWYNTNRMNISGNNFTGIEKLAYLQCMNKFSGYPCKIGGIDTTVEGNKIQVSAQDNFIVKDDYSLDFLPILEQLPTFGIDDVKSSYKFTKNDVTQIELEQLTNKNGKFYIDKKYFNGIGNYQLEVTLNTDNRCVGNLHYLVNIEVIEAEEADKNVTPLAPTLDKNVACEVNYEVVIPTQEGVEYTKGDVIDGKVKVVATAKEGYKLVGQAEWTLDVTNNVACGKDKINMEVNADGLTNKVKSSTINVKFTAPVDVSTPEDFEVLATNRDASTINVDKVEKNNDELEYKLYISGDWKNETNIVVFKTINSDVRNTDNSYIVSDTTVLYNKVNDEGGFTEVDTGNPVDPVDPGKDNKLPSTGNNELAISLIIVGVSVMSSIGLIRIRNN